MLEIEMLYNKYFSRVYSFAIRLSSDDNIAREITQQTFFKALMKSKKLSEDANVFSWLCQIAKNTYIDYLRKEKRIKPIEDIEEIGEKRDLEQEHCEKERILKIHERLHELKEPYKEVFMMRVFGELSYREIGSIFSKTENWARVTYFRATIAWAIQISIITIWVMAFIKILRIRVQMDRLNDLRRKDEGHSI